MAIFTPRGLKVRLSNAYAFALMARLYPKKDAFYVLSLTEHFENIPSLVGFLAGVLVLSLKLEPLLIGLIVLRPLQKALNPALSL